MRHDQLFKAVLQNCFEDFMRLFYPDVAERLDFETLRFLEKELFTDFPEGSRREADVVAEVRTREGDPEIVLVHVEVQSRSERDFARRMFRYYAALSLRYPLPVFPVVLYLRGGSGLTEEVYRVALFDREVLRFCFQSVGLAHLDAQEYLEESPLGAALAALMDRSKATSPPELRVEMMSRVLSGGFDEARKELLVNVIESYFGLSETETVRYRELVSRKESRKMEDIDMRGLTWAGEIELKAKSDTLLRQLAKKFGPLSDMTVEKVHTIELEDLDAYLERVVTASSLEEMELA